MHTPPVPHTWGLCHPVVCPSLLDTSFSYTQAPLPMYTFKGGHSSSTAKILSSCSQASVPQADTCLRGSPPPHHRGRSLAHGCSQRPALPPCVACPSPRLSGVPGTAGMAPTRKNHHSRRIASAEDASSAVQMMIKCYCVRESSKEGLISFIVRKGYTGPPAPNSGAGLTRCMLGKPGSHVGEDDRQRSQLRTHMDHREHCRGSPEAQEATPTLSLFPVWLYANRLLSNSSALP